MRVSMESFKFVSWDSVVLLGIALSNYCRLGGHYNDPRTSLAEAFLRGRRCPMSTISMGGREWEGEPSTFPYLQAAVAHAQWADTLEEEMILLRRPTSMESVNNADWVETIMAWGKDDFSVLRWTSATSGATITITPRAGSKGFIAVYRDGHKKSQYQTLFNNMSDNNLTDEEINLLVAPTSQKV